MMMFQNRFLPAVVLFILFSLVSCKNSGNRADDKDPGQNQVSQAPEIPGATPELIQKLLDECTGIDYIFDNWPISMSQDEDPSIDQNIMFIDLKRPVGQIPPHCRKEGRKFLKMGAEEAYSVDFYFGDNCNFYVFRDKKNMPLYANYMTSAGVNFYQNIFNQVKTTIQSQ